MSKFRNFLALIICLLISILTLSACSKQQTNHQRTTITFWHGMTGEHKTDLDSLIQDFNHSQNDYKVVGVSEGNFTDVQKKIMVAAKSKTLPTIAQTAYTNVPNYVHGDLLTSFNPYIGKQDLKDIYPVFLESSQYQGKYYAMPFSKSTRVLFYNTKLLRQNHISIPKTWEDVQKAGQQVKDKGLTGLALDQSYITELDSLTSQAGSKLITSQPKKDFHVDKASKAANIIWEMLQNQTATTAGTEGYGSSQFFKGHTLFYSGSSAAISILEKTTPKDMEWQTTTLPSYDGRKATTISGNDIVMFKSASKKQRQGAAEFVKFLMSNKQTIKWAKETGYVPLTKSAQKDANYQRYLTKHKNQKAALDSLDFAFQDKMFLGYEQSYSATLKSIDQMTTSKAFPKNALYDLKQQEIKIAENHE